MKHKAKIAIVCSHGGHLTESMQIMDAFEDHKFFFATYHSTRNGEVQQLAPAYFMHNVGVNPLRMLQAFGWALWIVLKERPDVIVSLGAEIALPFFVWGKLTGARTIFIESWCRIENLSLTGKLVYPIVDVFWVQWPQLLSIAGPKAKFRGAVI
ncbi:MAG: PssD/Cps14F family polysaccharide biosynthesis glycosyltransferase [Caldilineaceae bacterium]